MTQKGIVTDKDDHFVFVTVRQTTACEGCHRSAECASDAGSSCASKLLVKAHNDCGANVGDEVQLETSSGRVLLYAFLVFVFPFFPALAAYFLVKNVTTGELLPILAALTALALFFLLLRLTLDRQSAKRCDRRASKILSVSEKDAKD